MFETWNEIKKYRESQGISIETLSERTRLSSEKILFLEAGDFSKADKIITRFQIKNYAQQMGLNYEELIELGGLKSIPTPLPAESRVESVTIKKTHSYRGRKKELGKPVIYALIVLGVFIAVFALNLLSRHFNLSSDLFEMTDQQRKALDDTPAAVRDSTLYKPVLPQVAKRTETRDITDTMNLYDSLQVRFPVRLNIFPKQRLSYRLETAGTPPKEDYIFKDTPGSLFFDKPGRVIFYNTADTRFVFSGLSFRDKDYTRVVIDINERGLARIYTKE
ncbi:MAG: helix-turn-helix domain-containing protein [Candidatus Marinimicrobia bacterium]|nr:helix-turn-helix domain-containing protein [Candidatus Neomarinimicrobiota bacterium]